VLPTCVRHGIGVIVWSPLSGGWLTGKYRRDTPPPAGSRAVTNPDHFDGGNATKFDAVERLQAIADGLGRPLAHVALAWATEHPAVSSVLLGPRTHDQLVDLLAAADLRLPPDVLDAIDDVVAPGTDLNPQDVGWVSPGLARDARRRGRTW
jgi:aryl-alcohol dehydrogenase (NADP+)